LVEFRQGHFAAASEWLSKVIEQGEVPARTAQACAAMAMSEFQLGRTNAARSTLAEGIKIAETKLTPGRLDWNDTIIAQILLREASAMITGETKPAEPSK
jgi:hypothetical protein